MSELNGDKARFQRLRKAKLRRRQRTREAWAAIRGGPADDGRIRRRVTCAWLNTGGSSRLAGD